MGTADKEEKQHLGALVTDRSCERPKSQPPGQMGQDQNRPGIRIPELYPESNGKSLNDKPIGGEKQENLICAFRKL